MGKTILWKSETIKLTVNFYFIVVYSGKPWTASAKLDVDSKQKSIKDLDTYALSRWEALLHFLAHDDKQPQDDSVSKDTILTLTHAGLM